MSDACCGGAGEGEIAHDSEAGSIRLRDQHELRVAVLAGVLVVGGLVVPLWGGPGTATIGLVAHLAAVVLGGSAFVPGAVRALLRRRIGVGTLMSIALVGALVLGQIAEAAMLAFLFSISEALEDYSVRRARRGLRALLALVPTEARVERGGVIERIVATELEVADGMVVMAGDRVATDGVVRDGHSSLDVSAITGESMPTEVGPGDAVYSGSVNGAGVLHVEVVARVADNSLTRVVAVVEDAQRLKGGRQRIADRIARPLVPGIMVLSSLVALIGSLLGDPAQWIERALVVLVAAAPCALAISIPVTVVAAVGAASRFGVLVKGGAALETLGAARTVALDKTGTLTANRPRVVEVVAANSSDEGQVLEIAAALERQSEHPLATAILEAAEERDLALRPARDVQIVPGHGLRGEVEGCTARLGKPGWVRPGGLDHEVARLQAAGATTVVVERDGVCLGLIGVRDELRPEARDVVLELNSRGLEVVMLTGDHERTALAVASDAGITDVYADLTPTEKSDLISTLQRSRPGSVVMVGDGINDAPALAMADTGIAMGVMGADVAIEAADVALMGADLRRLPLTVDHARRARRIMLQNIALSLLIIVALVPLAALGVLGLAAVVLVHEVAEVVVIGNAVRAGRHRGMAAVPAAMVPADDVATARECECCGGGGQSGAPSPASSVSADSVSDWPTGATR